MNHPVTAPTGTEPRTGHRHLRAVPAGHDDPEPLISYLVLAPGNVRVGDLFAPDLTVRPLGPHQPSAQSGAAPETTGAADAQKTAEAAEAAEVPEAAEAAESRDLPEAPDASRGLHIDPVRYTASVDGRPLDLTYLEFGLLAHLAAHPHRVHSRAGLMEAVWGYDHPGDGRTVDVHVARLRRKLGPVHREGIVTVRRVGYKYVPSV